MTPPGRRHAGGGRRGVAVAAAGGAARRRLARLPQRRSQVPHYGPRAQGQALDVWDAENGRLRCAEVPNNWLGPEGQADVPFRCGFI